MSQQCGLPGTDVLKALGRLVEAAPARIGLAEQERDLCRCRKGASGRVLVVQGVRPVACLPPIAGKLIEPQRAPHRPGGRFPAATLS